MSSTCGGSPGGSPVILLSPGSQRRNRQPQSRNTAVTLTAAPPSLCLCPSHRWPSVQTPTRLGHNAHRSCSREVPLWTRCHPAPCLTAAARGRVRGLRPRDVCLVSLTRQCLRSGITCSERGPGPRPAHLASCPRLRFARRPPPPSISSLASCRSGCP